ncbi:MAG: hypothetical protein K6D97_05875 [Clostridia bacterium]|nr:hypothetical protein [Clostridia bacterium]
MRKKNIVIILSIVWVILGGSVLNFIITEKIEYNYGCPQSSETEGFNSTFTSYQGEQTGSQVKALLNRLDANANTCAEEPAKIPNVSYNSNGESDDKNFLNDKTYCEVTEENNISDYKNYLEEIRIHIDLRHVYCITMSMDVEDRIKGITINYNKESQEENFEINKKTKKLKAIDGISLFSSKLNESDSKENIDK